MGLCLTRKEGQSIKIGEDIEVIVHRIKGKQVKIVIKAPEELKIFRSEILERDGDAH